MAKQEITELVVNLSKPQGRVMDSRASVTLNMAGQGGGKTQVIGYLSGGFAEQLPRVKQFIGANTYIQLSQSTLSGVFKVWTEIYGFEEYDPKAAPWGNYVVDKKPPLHFDKLYKFRTYDGIISFSNGAVIFTGSLENYKAHEGKEFGIAHLDETKDTEEKALKDVIMGRLRQYGIWYDQNNEIYFADTVTKQMAKDHGWPEGERFEPEYAQALGWTAWTPLYIHTSPARGGTPWLNAMFELNDYAEEIKKEVLKEEHGYFYRRFSNKCVVIYSTHHNKRNLSPNYIEDQKASKTDEEVLCTIYAYPFGKTGGEYYPYFSRGLHVKPTPFIADLQTVAQTWDFNSVPFMTLLCAQFQYVTRYMDSKNKKHTKPATGLKAIEVLVIRFYRNYCLKAPLNTTEACCEAFCNDHNPTTTEVEYYGDANGLRRIPGLGSQTNFKIIAEHEGMRLFLHNTSKKVRDPNVLNTHRRDLLNKILAGKIPEVEIQFDPSMEETIDDFENVKHGPKGKVKKRVMDEAIGEKVEKWGHPTDAVEYLVSEVCKQYITNN